MQWSLEFSSLSQHIASDWRVSVMGIKQWDALSNTVGSTGDRPDACDLCWDRSNCFVEDRDCRAMWSLIASKQCHRSRIAVKCWGRQVVRPKEPPHLMEQTHQRNETQVKRSQRKGNGQLIRVEEALSWSAAAKPCQSKQDLTPQLQVRTRTRENLVALDLSNHLCCL